MTLPSLRLKANADRRLRAGHLWVYSNEVDTAATPLAGFVAGDQALLEAAGGKPLGIVGVSPNNLICARLLTTLVVPVYWLAYQAAMADSFGSNTTKLAVVGSTVDGKSLDILAHLRSQPIPSVHGCLVTHEFI